MHLEDLIEAILFSASQPLSSQEIASLIRKGSAQDAAETFAKIKAEEVGEALLSLQQKKLDAPIRILEVAGGWQLGTNPALAPWVGQISGEPRSARLTQAALETLAVIAYRQPVSRAEIESVRGVSVGGVIETLVEKEIIRVAGRAETPGRPWLYETTSRFLEHFGISDISQLPNIQELSRIKLSRETPVDPAAQPELIHEPAETTQ